MTALSFILAIIIGLFILGVLVFVHELGHFVAAKACKFKVLAFALGFGRPLLKWKRGDTEYRINAIPFGGYVAMAGSESGESGGADGNQKEDVVSAGDSSKPIWQRATVALAGPIANFIFAILTLWATFIYGIDRPLYMDSTKVGVVISGSPADSAGFWAGDSIVAINGEPVSAWEQVEMGFTYQSNVHNVRVERGGELLDLNLYMEKTGARFPKYPGGGLLPQRFPPVIGRIIPRGSSENILKAGDTILSINRTSVASFDHVIFIMREYDPESGPISLDIRRGSETLNNVFVMPAYDSLENRYLLGIEHVPGPTRVIRYSPAAAFGPAMKKSWEYTVMIFDVIGKLFSGKVSANQLAGPLNIIPVSGLMAFQGLSIVLNFMALIGINLAVLNLLPLVITDGGQLMFLIIEAIRGKPLPIKAQAAINRFFILLFIALFLFVSFNDIQRLPDFFRWLR
ncbi:MAG: RIP metalloprotease RseP [Chitinispirillales bacterium]|jgi:regulator of sigma E protease|nr:RIP metalloprotease RseP [Chitinispirillales bacterium]